jgi:hypothetical protein
MNIIKLIGGDWNMAFIFHIWDVILPIDELHHFSGWRKTTSQKMSLFIGGTRMSMIIILVFPQIPRRSAQVLSLLLQREGYEELAEKCIFVAGHKAVAEWELQVSFKYPLVNVYIWKITMLLMGKFTTFLWPFSMSQTVSHYQRVNPISSHDSPFLTHC